MVLLPILLITCILFVLVKRSKKYTPPNRTEKQKQADELITVILPTINNDN